MAVLEPRRGGVDGTTTADDILLAGGPVEIKAAGKTPTVFILAYGGGLMTVPGWGPLVIDLAGLEISASQIGTAEGGLSELPLEAATEASSRVHHGRLIPILADHDSTLKGIVGHGRASVRGGKLVVAGTIAPSSEAARQIIELAKTGFGFQASVGVSPTEYERIRPGETVEANGRTIKAPATGFLHVKAGALREVSIVAIAADRDTSVSIAASERSSMTTETTLTAEELREQAAAETQRIHAIRTVCDGRFGDIEARAIRENWTRERAELEVLRASRPKPPAVYAGRHPANGQVIEAAILAHMGCESLAEQHLGPQTAQQARDLRATNLVDLCRAALLADGKDVPHGREAMIRAALST